jgi:bifunctional non-homologous end joining protein LigD
VPATSRVEVEVERRKLKLSNLDKVMYPETGFTKGQVIDYYTRVAPALLPHLKGRPLTLKRYPEGVGGQHFYEKNCPSHRPPWVKTKEIEFRRKAVNFCICDDLPTLVWMANLADLELHPSLSLAKKIERPTMMAFDLDPGEPAALLECCEVALALRETLSQLGLECFPKTSGSKGMQVYVPINQPKVTYDHTKPLSKALAQHMEQERPDLVVSSQKKSLRPGKVLIDWSQNDAAKTTVSVYSLRARERPTVSTPLQWDEVESTLESRDAGALVFEAEEALERVAEHGDLFAQVLELKQRLPEL